MTNPNNHNDRLRDWDVITATMDGSVVWRRYGDGLIVTTRDRETPQEALARHESSGASATIKSTYTSGHHVKVEFRDQATAIGEWMWVRVSRCDDEKQLVFGNLDTEPLNDYDGQIGLGSELAVSFSQIREHRKPTESTKQ